MSTGEVFVSIVEGVNATMGPIRAEVPSLTSEGGGEEERDGGDDTREVLEENAEEMLEKAGGSFESILRFVWATHHHPGEISTPITSSLQENATVQ